MAAVLLSVSARADTQAVFGSDRASQFLRAVQDGTDSLDMVTIGDSNAGSPASGGWNNGLIQACLDAGLPPYASSLKIVMQNAPGVTLDRGPWLNWLQMINAPTGTLLSGKDAGPAQISALCVPNTTLRPHAIVGVNWAYVAGGTTSQTFTPLNDTMTAVPANAWCAPGTPLRFRVVYPTFPSGSGSIRPTVWNATAGAAVAVSPSVSTNTGAYSLAVAEVPFVMPAGARVVAGWNYVNAAAGPAGAVYESIYRVRKGFSGTNVHYHGGATVTEISGDVSGAGTAFWKAHLGELLARQIAAGGSGRILVWMNGGVNGPSNYTQWTIGMEAMVNAIAAGFAAAGGNADNLAIIASVSHPSNSPALAATEAVLTQVRTQAETWPALGTHPELTYLNIAKIITADQIQANGWFPTEAPGQAHLTVAGYVGVAQAIVSALLAYQSDPPLQADFNHDGRVDGTDLGYLLGAWGSADADLNGDDTTDGTDIGILLGEWTTQ